MLSRSATRRRSRTWLAWPIASSMTRRRSASRHLDIPTRSLSNVRYNKSKRLHRDGLRTRTAGSCSTCRRPRATCRRCSWPAAATQLIEQGKTTSIRGLYYLLKHTIEGTKEETFDDQAECDPVIEDVEVLLNSLREELHVYARTAATWSGDITLVDSGDEIDCSRMGSGGYGIPSIVEPEVIEFKKCDGQVHPARRKGHRLAAVQRRQVLAEAQLHSHPRRRPAAPRRAADAAPPAQRAQAAGLLPAG